MHSLLRGKPFPIFGDGAQTRSFSYIAPVAECIASAPWVDRATDAVFNVGGDEPMSVLRLAREIAQLSGSSLEVEWLPPRKEVYHAHCSHTLARSVFPDAFARSVSIREGLAMMYEHVRRNPVPFPTACPSPVEIMDQLPPSWRVPKQRAPEYTSLGQVPQHISG